MKWMGLAALTWLAACAPAAKTADEAAENGCAASAKAAWQSLAAEAFTWGPSCEKSVATIVLRAADGAVLISEAAPAEHLFGLNEAKDAAAMKQKLAEWLDQQSSPFATSDKLPVWTAGADAPAAGEFPFHPDIDREGYEALRAANVPIFCHVQGMESQACYALRDGALERIGVQQFPG